MTRVQINALRTSLCVFLLAVPAAWAQQSQQPQQQSGQQPADQSSGPIPAYRSPLASAAGDNQDEDEPQVLAPDTRSLSGAQDLSLGIPTARSYWQPHFDISVIANSNPLETAQSSGWGAWTSLSGGIDLNRTSGSNDMSMSYVSGGIFANYPGMRNGIVQEMNFVDKFAFHRSSLSFVDTLKYLPESSLGFGGLGGIAPTGGGSSGLNSVFAASQSLLIGYGQNLANSFATELDTYLTPRTSLTFVGGYSLLHYFDSDLLNNGDFSFRGGYNYQMTRKDTIAVLYTFSGIRYSNFNQSIDNHTVQASYARRVTGRLAFQVAAGPQIVLSRIPISGNAGSASGESATVTNSTQLYWSLNTALQFQAERTLLGLTYNHGVGGGSGVLAGSLSDIVTGSVTRQVSRTFSNGLTAGYSRNQGVAITSSTPLTQTYDYWFAGVNLAHPVGRALGLTFSYQMHYQTSNSTFCVGPTCGTNVIAHLISVGVGWHERPLLF